jgi:uncharacterized protein YlzI (FlbEa/FlbD family)
MVPKGWIEVTQLNGNKQTISIPQIVSVRIPLPQEFDPGANSVVEFANGKFQAVTDTRDAVVQQIADQTPRSPDA